MAEETKKKIEDELGAVDKDKSKAGSEAKDESKNPKRDKFGSLYGEDKSAGSSGSTTGTTSSKSSDSTTSTTK